MDEVKADWFDESNWKKVLDRMPQKLPAGSGGKTIDWTPVHIIMISNHVPPPLFRTDAFKSRIHKINWVRRPPFPMKQTELNYDPNDPDLASFEPPAKKAKISGH